MNSWSRLCWPILMSSRSSSRNFWSYHSSHRRVAAIRLDAARGLQGQQVACAQVVAVDLQGADVEGAAVPAEGALGIQLQQHLGQAVIGRALLGAAGHVAQHLAGFLQREGDAVFAERCAQPPHVAEHVVAARDAVHEAERPAYRRGCCSPGWSCSSVGTWIGGRGGESRADPMARQQQGGGMGAAVRPQRRARGCRVDGAGLRRSERRLPLAVPPFACIDYRPFGPVWRTA